MLSITSAPADAACLRITVKGATTAIRTLPLMTGMSTVFMLDGLPLGAVEFTGEAFAAGCGSLGANPVASYVSEVVHATLADHETIDIALALRRSGRANVAVDFPGGGMGNLPNGAPCAAASACASGFCADGVCCNTACIGGCQSCNRMPLGTCGPDPVGTTCSAATCMGTSAVPPAFCNAMSMCQPAPPQSCAPFVCQNGACRTSCTSSAECQSGFVCQNGTCVGAGQPNGSACSAAGQCASGFCAGGVCCNTACTGTCQACNIMPGNCLPLPAGVNCGSAACMGSTLVPAHTCNGTGGCVPQMPHSCSPYACQNAACRTSCASTADCLAGFSCQMGLCVTAGQPSGSTCSAASQCASGFCVDGVCCNSACDGACLSCNRMPAGTCTPDPAGVLCGAASCMDGISRPGSTCNGLGMCVTIPPRNCAPYVCDGSGCRNNCASNADCQAGFSCQSGVCQGMGMTVTLGAEADAYVRDGGAAAMNFGSDPALPVKYSTTAGNHRIVYLRFPLAAVGSVGQARLRLYGSRATASMLTDAAFLVTSNMWTETGITWNARPMIGGKLGASVVVGSAAQYHEWDVTAHVQSQKAAGSGAVTLAVQMETATGNSPDSFNSREAGSNPPQLVVTP